MVHFYVSLECIWNIIFSAQMFIKVEWCAFSFAISPHFCGKIINQLICSLNISSSYLPTKAYGCADSNANTRAHITKVTIKRH